jgi:hypothetical protein
MDSGVMGFCVRQSFTTVASDHSLSSGSLVISISISSLCTSTQAEAVGGGGVDTWLVSLDLNMCVPVNNRYIGSAVLSWFLFP